MRNRHEAMGKRFTWLGMMVLLAALLLASAEPAHARGGRHGLGRRYGVTRHHRFFAQHVFLAPSVVAPFGPYWDPFWPSDAYPPVMAVPSTQVYVLPSLQISLPHPPRPSWYSCENPPGYYPYVPQCPGGWRQVATTPPQAGSPSNPSGDEQEPTAMLPPSWYYCDTFQGYYPYVQQCSGGWRPVAPAPP